jgi:hypothetical protein
MAASQEVVTELTGMVAFVLVVGIPATFLLSFAILRRYCGTVTRLMRQSRSPGAQLPIPEKQDRSRPAGGVRDKHDLAARMFREPWRMAMAYLVAGIIAAIAMTIVLLAAASMEFLPIRVAVVALVFAWPAILTVNLVAANTPRQARNIVLGYFAVFAAMVTFACITIPTIDIGQMLTLWAATNVVPTLLVWAVLQRRIRAIGPLVLALVFLSLLGSNLALAWLKRHLSWVADLASGLGLGGMSTFLLVAGAGLLLFGLLGWLALNGIGTLYRSKMTSDQALTIDAVWVVFVLIHATFVTFSGGPLWFAIALLPFAVFRIAAGVLLRLFVYRSRDPSAPRLLFLRVFALGRRGERLWDILRKTWRHVGCVRMIAGPDLAASGLEPHEFLTFVSGRLASRFIDSEAALAAALASVDDLPDRDGQFRVNEFFCRDDAWRAAFLRLAGDSDVVLMDLRSFSPRNQGCLFEIEQLITGVPASRIIFLVDSTTDRAHLETTLDRLLPKDGSGAQATPAMVGINDTDTGHVKQLVQALAAAAA